MIRQHLPPVLVVLDAAAGPDNDIHWTSGSKTAGERPGMKKLLAYVEPGDTLVVWRTDRLGRSIVAVLNTVDLLRERNVHLKSVSDGIDPATTSGRLMLNTLATLAEYQREGLSSVSTRGSLPRKRAEPGSAGHSPTRS